MSLASCLRLATAFTIAVVMAACSDDSNPIPSPAPTSTTTAAASTPDDAGAHDAEAHPAPTVNPPAGGGW